MAKVRILPERVLPDHLEGARPQSHYRFCCCPAQQEFVKTAMDSQGHVLASINMLKKRQVNTLLILGEVGNDLLPKLK